MSYLPNTGPRLVVPYLLSSITGMPNWNSIIAVTGTMPSFFISSWNEFHFNVIHPYNSKLLTIAKIIYLILLTDRGPPKNLSLATLYLWSHSPPNRILFHISHSYDITCYIYTHPHTPTHNPSYSSCGSVPKKQIKQKNSSHLPYIHHALLSPQPVRYVLSRIHLFFYLHGLHPSLCRRPQGWNGNSEVHRTPMLQKYTNVFMHSASVALSWCSNICVCVCHMSSLSSAFLDLLIGLMKSFFFFFALRGWRHFFSNKLFNFLPSSYRQTLSIRGARNTSINHSYVAFVIKASKNHLSKK